MTATSIALRDCRPVEEVQQSLEFAVVVRSDGKSASIKSISEYIQPELVMGGLRAITESMEATPHHNMPARLPQVPKVGQWMPFVPLPLERGSGTPITPGHRSWCTWMR